MIPHPWFRWFAWRPVVTEDRGVRWLRFVYRRRQWGKDMPGMPLVSWWRHRVEL
jgi:hypothetical protein